MNLDEFEKKWYCIIKDEILKNFPDDFIEDNKYQLYDLPGKPLIKGTELFGSYELLDTAGNSILTTSNLDKIKYLLYSNRNNPIQIKLLTNNDEISTAVNKYEIHLDSIVKMIMDALESEFLNSGNASNITNKIFQLLNLQRY